MWMVFLLMRSPKTALIYIWSEYHFQFIFPTSKCTVKPYWPIIADKYKMLPSLNSHLLESLASHQASRSILTFQRLWTDMKFLEKICLMRVHHDDVLNTWSPAVNSNFKSPLLQRISALITLWLWEDITSRVFKPGRHLRKMFTSIYHQGPTL